MCTTITTLIFKTLTLYNYLISSTWNQEQKDKTKSKVSLLVFIVNVLKIPHSEVSKLKLPGWFCCIWTPFHCTEG